MISIRAWAWKTESPTGGHRLSRLPRFAVDLALLCCWAMNSMSRKDYVPTKLSDMGVSINGGNANTGLITPPRKVGGYLLTGFLDHPLIISNSEP